MSTQPHTGTKSAALAARYRELKKQLRAADSECLSVIGQDEYAAADAKRKSLRADTRNAGEQLYSADPEAWRAIEAASTINAANTDEENIMKNKKNTTAATATIDAATTAATNAAAKKGSSKKASKKAAAEQPEQVVTPTPVAEAPRELTVELDGAQQQPAAAKGAASRATRQRAARAVAETTEALAERAEQTKAEASAEGQPAAAKGGSRKGGTKGASKAAANQPAATGEQQQTSAGRTEKLVASAVSIFDRINKSTAEKPVTRGDLASNGDRNIARGLSKLELVVRLEDEKGRNIRYHAKPGVDAKAAHERIKQVATSEPKTFA